MNELARMPKGTHIGQLNNSWLESLLPPQFLMEYDYNFLYLLRYNVERLRKIAHHGGQIIAHSVLDELTLYLIVEESRSLFEDEYGLDDYIFDWVFDYLKIWILLLFYIQIYSTCLMNMRITSISGILINSLPNKVTFNNRF